MSCFDFARGRGPQSPREAGEPAAIDWRGGAGAKKRGEGVAGRPPPACTAQ